MIVTWQGYWLSLHAVHFKCFYLNKELKIQKTLFILYEYLKVCWHSKTYSSLYKNCTQIKVTSHWFVTAPLNFFKEYYYYCYVSGAHPECLSKCISLNMHSSFFYCVQDFFIFYDMYNIFIYIHLFFFLLGNFCAMTMLVSNNCLMAVDVRKPHMSQTRRKNERLPEVTDPQRL